MAIPPKTFEDDKEEWLITYADAITLLMAFFVMLLTFAEYDIPAFEEAAAAIKSKMSGREETSPIQLLKIDVEDVVFNMQADQVVTVETDGKGIVIELDSSAFYKPGSADIRQEAIPVLDKMAQTLLAPRYQTYIVEVEGHTDDDPINTPLYPSNWELSAQRATRVVRFLIAQGMEAFRMRATGFADTKPKAPNVDPQGNPIPENKAKNRRVAIRVYPMSLDQKEAFLRELELRELQKEAQAADEKEAGAATAPEGSAGEATADTPAPPASEPVGQSPAGQ